MEQSSDKFTFENDGAHTWFVLLQMHLVFKHVSPRALCRNVCLKFPTTAPREYFVAELSAVTPIVAACSF